MSGHVEVRIICTGRGQHRRLLAVFAPEPPRDDAGVWVGDAEDLRQNSWDQWEHLRQYNRGHDVVEANAVERTADGWRLRCVTCKKTWPVTDEVMGREVLRRARAGVSEMDVNPKRC